MSVHSPDEHIEEKSGEPEVKPDDTAAAGDLEERAEYLKREKRRTKEESESGTPKKGMKDFGSVTIVGAESGKDSSAGKVDGQGEKGDGERQKHLEDEAVKPGEKAERSADAKAKPETGRDKADEKAASHPETPAKTEEPPGKPGDRAADKAATAAEMRDKDAVDQERVTKTTGAIYADLFANPGKVAQDLEGTTDQERKAIKQLFHTMTGQELEDFIKARCPDADRRHALDVLNRETKEYPDRSQVTVDGRGRVTEVVGPSGRVREFKYDDSGELTEIKGHLGNWERKVDEQGRVAWHNDKGAVWNGDFRVDSEGNLHFLPEKGQAWVFARDGRDVAQERGAASAEHARLKEEVEDKSVDKYDVSKRVDNIVVDLQKSPAVLAEELEGTPEAERKAIKELFKSRQGRELEDVIKEKLTGDAREHALQLLHGDHRPEKAAEVTAKAGAPAQPGESHAAPAEKTVVPTDARASETAAAPTDAKPSEKPAALADARPMTYEQQKAIETAGASTALVTMDAYIHGRQDAGKVLETLQGKTQEELKVIKELYKKAHGVELEDDLREKFSGDKQISKVFDLLGTPPEKRVSEARLSSVASELNFHTTFMGKDPDAVVKILQNSSEMEIQAYKTKYKMATGKDLEQSLAEAYDGLELKRIQHFLHRKDSEAAQLPQGVDRDAMLKADLEIQAAAQRNMGLSESETFNKLLAGKKPVELQAMDALYKERYGISLNDQFMNMMPPMTLEQRVAKANEWKAEQESGKIESEASKLYAATTWFGDQEDIRKALAGKTEAEINALDQAFRNLNNGKTLEQHFKEKLDEPERSRALQLLHHKDADLAKIPDGADRAKLRQANEAIYDYKEIGWFSGGREEQYFRMLAGKTPEQIEAMKQLFRERYGVSLDDHLKEKFGPAWTSFEDVLARANKWQAGEKAFEADIAKVDRARTEKLLAQLDEAEKAKPPVHYYESRPVIGWPPGEHPAEQLIQSLSAAELTALQDAYREKHGYGLKSELSKLEFGVGERLERTLDRDRDGALDKLPAAQRADARTRAETLYRAMLSKKEPGGDTPEDAFFTALEKQSPEQRAAIAEAFRELSGTKLEDYIKDHFSGDKEEKALNYLQYGSRDEVANVHLALSEGDNEKVRMLISTMKADEIAKLKQEFQRYGQSLEEAINSDKGLTDATKEALKIYLKGADRITDQDRAALLELSLHANEIKIKGDGVLDKVEGILVQGLAHPYGNIQNRGDVKMFDEIMAGASPEFRQKFMDAGGQDKVEGAFAFDGWRDALEYAKHGHLSLEREIKKQIGFWSDDHDAILKAADENHDDEDHKRYIEGARVFQKYRERLTDDQKATFELAARMPAYASSVPDLPNADDMSESEKKAYAKFQAINSAMDRGLYNDNGMKFRDHVIYSGGVDQALRDLDDPNKLSWDQLQKFKTADGKMDRAKVADYMKAHNLDLLSEPAQEKICDAIERRLAAKTPDELKYADGQSLEKAMEPRRVGMGTIPPDADKVLDAIQHMNLEDQKKYRTDADFRKKVDMSIQLYMNDEDKTAARHMLDSVTAGKYPEGDFIDKIYMEGGKKETDEPQVIRYLEDEFRRSEQSGDKPTLHERITHPRPDHPEDQALKDRLDKALHKALEDDEYERWGKPVIANGRLTIEQKMDIDKEKGDKKSSFTDIKNLASAQDLASSEERHKIVTDEYFRERVLRDLPKDQRELAESMLKQGEAEFALKHINKLATAEDPASLEERKRFIADKDYREQVLAQLPEDKRPVALNSIMMHDEPVIKHIMALATAQDQTSLEERKRLVSDRDYREQVLGKLPEGERQLAESLLLHGQPLQSRLAEGGMTPEDMVRSYVLGTGISKEEMMSALKQLTPEQNEQLHEQYALKYHQDVVQVLSDKLSGDDKATVLQEIRIDPITAREALEDAQEVVAKSNSGFGADFTRFWGSGAGDIAADRILQLQAKIEQAKAEGKEFSLEEAKKLADDAREYTRLFEAAKEKAADEFANAVLTAASFVVPGGMSLRLLVLATGGGLLKVGLKEAIAGHASAEDFVSGFLTTGLSALGPGEIAKAAGLGEKIAVQAGKRVAAEGEKLLVEGAEKKLASELEGAAANAFAHGGGVIEDKVINRIVDKYAKEGATEIEKTALANLIKKEFEDAARQEIRQGIKNTIIREGLGATAGAAGGAVGAVSEAAFHWDSSLSFSDNMSRILDAAGEGAIGGAKGALIFGNAFKIGGKAFHAVFGKEPVALGQMKAVASEGEFVVSRPENAPAPTGKPMEVSANEFSRVGNSDFYVNGERKIYQKVGEGADGKIKLLPDEHATVGMSDEAIAKAERAAGRKPDVTAHGAPEVEQGARPKPTVESPVPNDRVYKVGDKEYGLMQMPGQGHWFWGGKGGSIESPVKIHVMVKDAADLGRLQEVLIPALKDNPELLAKVSNWKTFDPKVGIGEIRPGDKVPTGVGQDSKGFTIYLENPADAALVQRKLDELLSEKGLGLKEPLATGTADIVTGSSNRVAIVRDAYPMAIAQDGSIAYKIDAPLAEKIHADPELHAKPGERLSAEQLRTAEQKSGLKEGTLAYDKDGNLVLKANLRGQIPEEPGRRLYAGEDINQKPGELTDRRAMYALGDRYGLDQGELAASTRGGEGAKAGKETFPAETRRSAAFEAVTGSVDSTEVSKGAPPVSRSIADSTAPSSYLTVDGAPIRPNQEVVIGRAGDIQVGDGAVSNRHASLRVDEHGNTYVKDLGSTNGTYINGKRIGPEHGEIMLRPGDHLNLGGAHEINWGRQFEPTYHVGVGALDVGLHVGQEVPVGSGLFGENKFVKSSQARMGMDDRGLYIIEDASHPSAHGTFVNGERIKPGEKVHLKPTDEVRIGDPYRTIKGEPQGEYLFIMPKEVSRVPDGFQPSNPAEYRKAVKESNDYAELHQISEPLKDGWQNAGQKQVFDADGGFSRRSRNAVVVDRANDPVLRGVIEEARERFGHLPPKQRAEALTEYVNKLLKPEGMSERSLDAWYNAFSDQHAGQRIYLGEYIKQGKGVCSQQATLLKVLGDELGLQVTLVRGAGDPSNLGAINHAWTEIRIPGEKEPLVYDPRQHEVGRRYEDLPAHRRGFDIEHGVAMHRVSPDVARKPADVIVNGKALDVDSLGVPIGRAHPGTVDGNQNGFASVSKDHAVLRRGNDGTLYIRDTSSGGTFLNGEKIPPGREVPVSPTDDVRLGAKDGPRLALGERPKTPAEARIGNSPLVIEPGEQIPIGRRHGMLDASNPSYDHVSGDHASIYRDPEGRLFIRDNSTNGTWVNGKRIPRDEPWPIGPNDSVRLGAPDGPEVTLTPRVQGKGAPEAAGEILPPGTVKPDSPVLPRKAVFGHEEWNVAGFDPANGDVILRQEGRGFAWDINARPVTDVDLHTNYRQVPVGDKTFYRDADGYIYELLDVGGHKQLVQNREFRAAPADKVAFRAPEQLPQPQPAYVPPNKAVYTGRQFDVAGFDPHSGDVVLRENSQGQRYAREMRQVTDADLASQYKGLPVGDKTYYRDANGRVFELFELDGQKQLISHPEIKVVPRDQVAFGGGDAGPPGRRTMASMDAVHVHDARPAQARDLPESGTEVSSDRTGVFRVPEQPQAPRLEDVLAKKTVYNGREFDLVGVDANGGTAIIRDPQERGFRYTRSMRTLRADDLASGQIEKLTVGDEVYYRDNDGKVYKPYKDSPGALVLQVGLTAVPRDQIKLRSEPIDAQRPVSSQEVAVLNPGRQLQVGERYTIRNRQGDTEEGWRLEGTTSDGRLLMSKESALRITEAPPQPGMERAVSAEVRPPVRPGDLDSEQMALRDGSMGLEFKNSGGNSGHDMTVGRVERPDGSHQEVIFHNLQDAGNEAAKSAVRLRKEMAAYGLNKMLDFDNGFPVTVPRDIVVDGKLQKGWLQEKSGETFEQKVREMADKRFGSNSDDAVSRLIKEDPELRKEVEQAFVERLIYGDTDNHAGNFVIVETPTGPKVQSIDLDYAFTAGSQPKWIAGDYSAGVNARLHADFSGQQLSEATLSKIKDFVQKYDTPAGREQLAQLGLRPKEVEGVLSRARWLAERGEFPKAKGAREVLAEARARARAEAAKPAGRK